LVEVACALPDAIAVPADMANEGAVRAMVERVHRHYGRIDILVNCAGRGYDAPLAAIDLVRFRELFELNVVGPLVAMQAVIPIMKKQKSGAIVNVSSGTSLLHLPTMSPYASLKRALNGLTLTAGEELREDNIAVSVVYPYITLTDFETNTLKDGDQADETEGHVDIPPPDTAGFVAERIVDGIVSGEAEIFAHDWMKALSG
jgi:NAD(P)-dependent dehydrogenase (short-subunit alcohol dehydrogenase family)